MASTLPPVPPPDRGDLTAPIRRNLVSAAVLVVAGGLLFGVVGMFRDAEPPAVEVVAQPTDDEVAAPGQGPSEDDAAPTTDDGTEVDATEADATDASSADATDEADTAEPVEDPSPAATPTPTPSPSPTPEPEPTTEPAPTATEDDGDRIPPGNVSIQVLDAVLDDDGEAARAVGEQLRGDGYRVVATNQAIRRYEQTTVMYTAGFEAEARQIAREYGFTQVEQKPDNLSDGVQIHLVVGADAA